MKSLLIDPSLRFLISLHLGGMAEKNRHVEIENFTSF